MCNKYVTYFRVYTLKQDLGIAAQQTIIDNYLKSGDKACELYREGIRAK